LIMFQSPEAQVAFGPARQRPLANGFDVGEG
jgi:hypothetical protein